jgi:hypothetical protein
MIKESEAVDMYRANARLHRWVERAISPPGKMVEQGGQSRGKFFPSVLPVADILLYNIFE